MEKAGYLYNVKVTVISGRGGNGCVSFRRERKVPKGGPDGGNGGRGGSIFISGDRGIVTLADFKYHRIWRAGDGENGSGQNCSGKSGQDITIKVPIGTQIWNADRSCMVHDIVEAETDYLVAQGGKGGLGNQNFATAELQAPCVSTKGEEGETKTLWFILKYMADIGIIGMPNAGKSTFVHKISRANVTIGDYPFSTITPVLGVVKGRGIIVADLPGLIEGSHMNVGLGHQFLQHLERCRMLVHMVDSSDPEAIHNFNIIRNEVAEYDRDLLDKTYCVCLTKADLVTQDKLCELQSYFKSLGYMVLSISEMDQMSINSALESMIDTLSI